MCAEDISKFCNITWFAGVSPGSVLACLKESRASLKPACQKEVFKLQLDAAEDYRQGFCHPDPQCLLQLCLLLYGHMVIMCMQLRGCWGQR